MPRSKRYVTKFQPLTGNDLEEQLARTVIIHPGSRYIRLAGALDREAVILPHCIVRKHRQLPVADGVPDHCISTSEAVSAALPDAFRNLHEFGSTKEFKASVVSVESWMKEYSDQEKATGRSYCSFDAKECEENPPATKQFYVGNEGLDVIALDPTYFINWPIHIGRFHLHDGPGGSRTAVAADIADLWDAILTNEMGIPKSSRQTYRVVLVIPDICDREDVRSMVDLVLNSLNFFAIFVVLENVASAFGDCIPSACVIDVGAEKTSISCVDDGLSLPETRIMLAYGGDDISRLCNWYFQQKLRAFTLQLDNYANWVKMDAIKKAVCHFDFAQRGSCDVLVNLPSPDREETVHLNIPHDMARFSGLVYFFDGLLAPGAERELVRYNEVYQGAADDIYGAHGKITTKNPSAFHLSRSGDSSQLHLLDGSDRVTNTATADSASSKSHTKFLELHRAIFWSISRCFTEDQQKKMLRNILLVGGGFALFPEAHSFLRMKLEQLFPTSQVCVLTNTREVPADLHAVKGAGVMAALETVQYLWITTEEWNRNGIKVLREKSCFLW